MWKKIYRVFVKTTLGVAFHHLDSAFINAYIAKLGGGEGGRGEELVFHHQGSTFLQWAYLSNDLPWPRRSVLFECL